MVILPDFKTHFPPALSCFTPLLVSPQLQN